MARRSARVRAERQRVLQPVRIRYENRRALVTLSCTVRPPLKLRFEVHLETSSCSQA